METAESEVKTAVPAWEESNPVGGANIPTWEESNPVRIQEKPMSVYQSSVKSREALYRAFSVDPLAVVSERDRPALERLLDLSDDAEHEKKKIALSAYFSMMSKKAVPYVWDNLDGFLEQYYKYNGKPMSVDDAYKDISGMLATAGKIAPAEQDGSKTGSLLKGSFSQLLGTVYNLGTTLLEGAVQYENVQRNLDGMGTRADEIHKDFNDVRNVTAGYYKDIAEKERAKLIDPDWATLEGVQRNGVAGTMKNLTLSVLFEAPNMAVQATAGAVNPALVPVMMGVTTAADKAYDLERGNSDMNEIQQMANIIGTGLVNGYLEKVTMGIFKGSGLKLEPETLKAGMKEAFKYYLKSIGKEGLEESAEQLAENAVDIATGRYGYGETAEERLRIVKEHLFEGVIESGVVGGAYGAPFAGVGHRNLRRADESKNRALNMLRTREAELKAKSDLTEIETAELRHIQTTLESGNLNETLGLAQDVAVEQEARRRADAEAAVERDAEMTSEERADAARQDYQLRRSMAHNPEDTADAVAETGAGYKVNVRACGTAEIASMETGRNAEEIRAFYDPETDTVVVNTDRVRPSEVPYLFLHEVAVHKGLDAVFGESRKNAVLDGLYGQMHEQIEAVNTGYGFDLDTTEGRRAATEEYLAECAEFCGHDWRKFDRENGEDVTRWLAEHNMALMRRKEGVRGVLEERGELSVRPAWWREFLQKVKMFFYGFKGFSNYRFTDREIETLLLRGYRKTRNARGAKAEGGDARFAALRREGAPNTAFKPGQLRDSRVPHEEGFMEKFRFDGKGLYADYEFLYGRHPEYFEDVEHVRAAVEFVLAQPEEAGNIRDNLAFVREDQSTGKVYRVEINPKIIGKRCQIRSVHEITQTQYKKIKDRTARGDSASPDSVRHEQEFKASEHPNMKTSDPSEKAKVGATPANAASPVLQPSQNRVRQTDTNGDLTGRNGRTVSDFLRYDSTESGKVKHSPEGGARFSIIGEEGAGRGREAEKRMSDLRIAREMETTGKDAKTIKRATGWERGGDGKWRMEIPDLKIKREETLPDGTTYAKSELSLKFYDGALGEYVDAPELFEAYPELRNIRLAVRPAEMSDTGFSYGYFDKSRNMIVVYSDVSHAEEFLVHEVQHAIQALEGFPGGGDGREIGAEYWKLAGEVEAYNAAKRRKMTAEEKRESLLEETADVAEEDKIYLTGAQGLEHSFPYADRYTLENAKASKEGYRVERVNENAGRDLTEAQGVVCEVNQVFNPEEAPEKGFKGWVLKKIREYETAHPLKGKYDTPALASEVNIVESSIRSIGNHAGPDAKYNLYPAIPDMLKNAVLIQTEAHDAQGSSSVLSRSHLLATKVRYGENRYVVVMVIHESNGEFYYDHSLLLLKEGELGNRKAEINEAEESKWNPAKTAGPASSSAQVLKVAREALLSSGFDTKSEKNLRFSIEQYSDADWSDMVTYMRSKVGDVLNHPDSDYRRMLEEAGMRCYSDADAHACAAEAMQQNEREIRERGKQRRDKWIYENELLYRLVVDFAGSDKFTLVPDSFTGEKFTGTWIAEEYRKYSEKRAQKPTESDKQYKRYLQTREKALARAKGYRLDEVAEAIARKTGRDTLEVQEELVDYFRDLKKPDLYHRYSEWRKNHEFDSSRLTNDLEEYEELQYAMAEEAIIALIEEKHEVTPGWISANRKAYNLLYKRVFGKDAPRGKAGAKDIADLNAALAQEKGDMAAFAAGIKEGRAQLSGEYLKKLGAFKKMIVEDWRNIRDVQYAAKKFAYENVDEGFRDKFISGIIRLSRFSAKGSKAYPDGRRAYEFDRLCEAMVSYQREVTKEKAIREIREMLDANRTKRTDKNVPYSPMRERQTALDRIAQIVRMDAETVQECQRYAGERISKAQEALEKLPEEAAEGADGKTELEAEVESAQREIWYLNHFGALGLKDAEFAEKSRKMLKEFIKTGREEFRAEMLARREEVEALRSAAIREMSGGDETIPSNRDLERKADGVSDYLMKSVSLPRLLDWISRSGNEFELEKSVAGKMLNLVEDSTRREKRRMNEMQSWFDRTLKDECGVKGIVEKGRFLNGALKEEDTGVPLVQYGTVLGEKDHKVAHWDMGRAKRTDGMRLEHCRKMLEDLKNGKEVTGYIGIHDVELSKSVRSGLKESGVKTGRFYSVCTTKEGFRIYTENESGETIGLDVRREDAPAELKALQEDRRNVLEISEITREGAKRQIQEYDAGATAAGRKALGDEIDEAAWKAFEEGRGRDQRVMLIAPGENVCSRVENLKTSPGGAMQLILNWEQPDYRAGMEWNGYTEETIGKLKDWLNGKNEGYLKLAYAMRDYLKREHAELDAAVYKRYGVHMPSTENFFYGDFSGSVASRISDPGYGNPSGGMTVSASFLTARRFHLIAPDVHGNAIGLFMRKQLEQNHFICWTETVRELRSVYGDRGVQNVLVREFGQAMWNNLREKIELLASNGASPDKAAKYLNYFFKSWAPANVALNMSSILKQFAGGTSYSLYIPQSALLRYLPEANWGNRDYRAWLERPEVKEFIADRMQGGLDPNYGGMMNYTRRGGKIHSVTEAGIKALMFPNLYSDKLTALTFGYAVYRYYYEQARKKTKRNAVADGSVAERETSIGEAEKFALRMWMRATDETQQSGALKDMNHFTASPGAWRYLTTFMTNPMQTAALELTAWQKWMKDRTKENRNVLIRRIVVNHLVNTTLMNLVTSVFRHGLNIGDYLDDWDDFVAGWLLGSFDSLWLFGKEAMMIKEGLAGNRYAGDMSAVPMLSELAKDAGTMRKIAEGKDVDFLEWMKMTGDVLMSAGPGLTRLPGILLYSLARQGLRVKRMFTEKK